MLTCVRGLGFSGPDQTAVVLSFPHNHTAAGENQPIPLPTQLVQGTLRPSQDGSVRPSTPGTAGKQRLLAQPPPAGEVGEETRAAAEQPGGADEQLPPMGEEVRWLWEEAAGLQTVGELQKAEALYLELAEKQPELSGLTRTCRCCCRSCLSGECCR